MNVEKYTGSKLYSFFEWLFKLILWNILLILIIMTLSIGPFYGFYKIQDNNLIDNIEFIDNGLIITQKNNKKTTIENCFGNFKSSDITIQKDDDNYTLQVKLENDVIITYSLKEEYKKGAMEVEDEYEEEKITFKREREDIDDLLGVHEIELTSEVRERNINSIYGIGENEKWLKEKRVLI